MACYGVAPMPLTYTIYSEAQMLFIRAQGAVTQPERIQTMLAWLADPEYERCLDALCDFSAATSAPKLDELRELITLLEHRLPPKGPRKLAIVVSQPVTFGVARVFEDLIGLEGVPLQVNVFFDREAAWQWLRPAMPSPGAPT